MTDQNGWTKLVGENPGHSQWYIDRFRRVGDLAELDLPARGIGEPFDAVVCAGNVMTFVAPSTRVEILHRMRRHLRDGGRIVIGFGADRGYTFNDFPSDTAAAELTPDLLLSTWDMQPFTEHSDYMVALLRRP